tara:strand:- start:693 stop:1043 length:351 start_codon:yes stop_codon:yes gene_type:complete
MRYLFVFFIFSTLLFSSTMEIDSTLIRNSKKARNLALIPFASQGQMYNGKYLKSFFFIAAQSYSYNRMLYFNQFSNKENIVNRNQAAWWFIGFYMSSIIDSYIDAEFSAFPDCIGE